MVKLKTKLRNIMNVFKTVDLSASVKNYGRKFEDAIIFRNHDSILNFFTRYKAGYSFRWIETFRKLRIYMYKYSKRQILWPRIITSPSFKIFAANIGNLMVTEISCSALDDFPRRR